MEIKKELLAYIVFGVLTTIVNFVVYIFFTKICGVNYVISNILAWFLSVLFAYITNRIWVFESKNSDVVKECLIFYSGRLFSGFLDTCLMILFIEILTMGDLISKIIIQILVIIVNYVFSKWIVFK